MTIISHDIVADLEQFLPKNLAEPIFILTDKNSAEFCLPALQHSERLQKAKIITIPCGDDNKNIETLTDVWRFLAENGATRHSLMINLGGGVVTDLGGFAAATFKRGFEFVNIPTTLLGAIDAATGGKTGINFLGLKNEVGAFAPAKAVLVCTDFFRTLDAQNLLSGFAEMVKHALIDDADLLQRTLAFDLDNVDYVQLGKLIDVNLKIKEKIVAADPHEQGLRKALNFGHTFGHAFETYSHTTPNPLLHGYAVMWGTVCELYLSHVKLGFPKDVLLEILYFAKENYGTFPFSCKEYEQFYRLMQHDKKNEAQTINFTFLADIGKICINQTATQDEIFEAIDFVREN